MDAMLVQGGRPLEGTVRASGAKNAALPIMAASLLAEGPVRLRNVPDLMDIRTMARLLRELGMRVEREPEGDLVLETADEGPVTAPYEIVKTMRAGICVLGPLLARRRRCKVSLPGGCQIGDRPIDLHMKGMRNLGARLDVEHGYILGACDRLCGTEMYLGGPFGSTVTGTANVLTAATVAEGRTVIDCAACEPEIVDLARFLVALGARIDGIGSPRLVVEGVERLRGAEHTVIPDRIEAGTFLIAGAATRGDVTVEGARWDDLFALVHTLREIGFTVEHADDGIRVGPARGELRSIDLTTLPFPGFPTDLQAQMMALLATVPGNSMLIEKVFPDRFTHVAELNRLGASIRKEGNVSFIQGPRQFTGAETMASDLRASATLVIAGLVAAGETRIRRIYHLDRGYERIEAKVAQLGGRTERIDVKEP